MANWKNRIIGSGVEQAGQLLANPLNWRIHPLKQQKAVTASLEEVGWVQEVIVNKRTGHIVDGHLRVSLALSRGEDTPVPVKYVDLTEKEERIVLAMLDPITGLAGVDKDNLAQLLEDLSATNPDLQAMLDDIAKENDIEPQLEQLESGAPAGGINVQNQFGIIVICDDEGHQQKVYEELTNSGYNCKVVVV